MNKGEKIDVLDLGYVVYHDHMGSDLSVVNSARVSYDKKSTEMNEKDERLLSFLAREGHTSPFRHANLQFEVYAPLMVARQHWKYIVGSAWQDPIVAWNESSRRYITENVEFYLPDTFRSAPENSKQGSGAPLPLDMQEKHNQLLAFHQLQSLNLYEQAIEDGMCVEQARLYLPAYGMYVRYYWSASLAGVCHFLNQRLAHDAQVEIQAYAQAIEQFTRTLFPKSVEVMVDGKH